ncbi:MAG: Veg family protein [bacterium]|nr:Veg family protein [bacterium]
MNIKKIKTSIEKNLGKELRFKFNGSRNQTEEFDGIIEKVYNYVFTIKISNNNNQIKSFSYNDVLTENLEIFTK